MRTTCYLTVDNDGKNIRATKSAVRLEPWQASVRVVLEIPDAYFERPQIEVVVEVPEPAETPAPTIDVSVAEEALRQATGHNVTVKILPAGDPQ